MNTLYEYITKRCNKSTAPTRFDFRTNSIYIGPNKIKYDVDKVDALLPAELDSEHMKNIEKLFKTYERSIPSKAKEKSYFTATHIDKLSPKDYIQGVARNKAKNNLEAYILCLKLQGVDLWEGTKGWYLRVPNTNCILLKEWFN